MGGEAKPQPYRPSHKEASGAAAIFPAAVPKGEEAGRAEENTSLVSLVFKVWDGQIIMSSHQDVRPAAWGGGFQRTLVVEIG